jgi:CRISPR-associated protein Csm1
MSELTAVVLGGLLHDLGKVGQRAGEPLSPSNRESENICCPRAPAGYYTHRHVLWSGEALDRMQDFLPPEGRSLVTSLVMHHHRPDAPLEVLLAEADSLSAGGDRIPAEEEGQDFRSARLLPVFAQVDLEDDPRTQSPYRYRLKSLTPETAFPVREESTPDRERSQQAYAKLWRGFLQECRGLEPALPLRLYLPGLTSLLEKWFSLVPSASYGTLPDVPLFDHLYTTACLAQALYLFHAAHDELTPRAIQDRRPAKFCLVALDLSGIQDFIFTMGREQTRGAAKLLRGRSAYLWLLEEVAGLRLEESFGLLPVARLAEAGGKAYYLVPNLPGAAQRLEDLRRELEEWLWQRFGGSLGLNLAWIELTPAELEAGRYSRTLDRLGQAVERAKRRAFATRVFGGELVQRGGGAEGGGPCPLCPLCDQRVVAEGLETCSICDQVRQLGQGLVRHRFVVVESRRGDGRPVGLELLGHAVRVLGEAPEGGQGLALVLALGEGDHLPFGRRWVANHVPRFPPDVERYPSDPEEEPVRPGEAKSFHHLARDATDQEGRGAPLLAMLKADVDRLGHVFGLGLRAKGPEGAGRLTMSRYAALSRMLGYFFTARLSHLQHHQGYTDLYTVFSGGDDLCLVGPWPRVVELARRLGEEFRAYTCHNPHLTLSAGISLFRPRLPVRLVAETAERALDTSKEAGRDRITLFDTTVPYGDYPHLLEAYRRLSELVRCLDLGQGFLHQLLAIGEMRRRCLEAGSLADATWSAVLHYQVARNLLGKGHRDQVLEPLRPFLEHDARVWDHWRIPLNLAILADRKAR